MAAAVEMLFEFRRPNGLVSTPLALELDEIERTGLEPQIVDVAVFATRIVDIPVAMMPAQAAPTHEAHVSELIGNDLRIVSHVIMVISACRRRHRQADRCNGECLTNKT